MNLEDRILDFSRQNQIRELTPWFKKHLNLQIQDRQFVDPVTISYIGHEIVTYLAQYREQVKIDTVVIGMSGGVDSALTAALYKRAGWKVIGVTMPINQNPEETIRGQEAIDALEIGSMHADLSVLYHQTLRQFENENVDTLLNSAADDKAVLIRRGNIRARLRMITLYNIASMTGGLVASTDNFSELAAGFWTLHGDVGDLAPIQSLNKSWEVPMLAKLMGVPEKTYRATPTDGLGISVGDEAQLGASYLEWDIMTNAIFKALDYMATNEASIRNALFVLEADEYTLKVFDNVITRIRGTWFKRANPINLEHPLDGLRLNRLEKLDKVLRPFQA